MGGSWSEIESQIENVENEAHNRDEFRTLGRSHQTEQACNRHPRHGVQQQIRCGEINNERSKSQQNDELQYLQRTRESKERITAMVRSTQYQHQIRLF
jgi:hypothetical protein